MRPRRRVDPVPLVATALALVASGLYLWLVDQKGGGRLLVPVGAAALLLAVALPAASYLATHGEGIG